MRQLRPHLADLPISPRACAAWRPSAIACSAPGAATSRWRWPATGWTRTSSTAASYVDDLVTHESSRGRNLGARLLDALTESARRAGCAKLVLDTGLSNALAQRFFSARAC